jgi:hypothetical protein
VETPELKRQLVNLIGDAIDEETLPDIDSFIEMASAVIHFAGEGGERYFRVTLTETTEDEYFKPYDPSSAA